MLWFCDLEILEFCEWLYLTFENYLLLLYDGGKYLEACIIKIKFIVNYFLYFYFFGSFIHGYIRLYNSIRNYHKCIIINEILNFAEKDIILNEVI